MPDLWTRTLTLRDEFHEWLHTLETLLCSQLCSSKAGEFPLYLAAALQDALESSNRQNWSGPSLVWDIAHYFHKKGYSNYKPREERPNDVLWPQVPRAYISHLENMPPQTGSLDGFEYGLACGEQVYDMLRCLAGMDVKTLAEGLAERGITLSHVLVNMEPSLPESQRLQAKANDMVEVDQHTAGASPALVSETPLDTLESQVQALETHLRDFRDREDELTRQLIVVREVNQDLYNRNLELAKKASEVEARAQRMAKKAKQS